MNKMLADSALTGVATLASGALLTKLYDVTNFHPPSPVFWFFIGFTAQLAVSVYKKSSASASVSAGLGGFGESTASIDNKIRIYQSNISGLKKILRVGSEKGKIAAGRKLAVAERGLTQLFRLRDTATI